MYMRQGISRRPSVLQLRSDKRRFPPYGLKGGHTGSPSLNILNPGPNQQILPTLAQSRIGHEEVIRHEMAGGGGRGDPLQREPQAVLDDVLNRRMSVDAARESYGVVLSDDGATIDESATAALRAQTSAHGS